MNEWMLAGAIALGTVIALGGGGFIMRAIFRNKKSDTPTGKA